MEKDSRALVAGVFLGAGLGILGSGIILAYSKSDDITLTNVLDQEPNKTLLNRGVLNEAHFQAAAAKGLEDLVRSVSPQAEQAREAAQKTVEAYLTDKTQTPVVKVPAAPAP